MSKGEALNLFNLETMSGVSPGTRTQIFQRVRLQPLAVQSEDVERVAIWAQLHWYADPPVCLLYRQGTGNERLETTPLLQLVEPLQGDFNQRLQAALKTVGWQLYSCGSCRHWQADTTPSPDGLPVGHCLLRQNEGEAQALPNLLASQSNLALACPHWQISVPGSLRATPQADAIASWRLTKFAEITESKLGFWQRMRRIAQRNFWQRWHRAAGHPQQRLAWQKRVLERSGVGAGTEPCFACQGRIANLAALAVETPDGDKQTFSLWRCRNCFTLYVNNWIDRWERLDNLETEEAIYRLAPAEAAEMLTVIDSVAGGEHPGRRQERNAERDQIMRYLADRVPVSHQIRQGR